MAVNAGVLFLVSSPNYSATRPVTTTTTRCVSITEETENIPWHHHMPTPCINLPCCSCQGYSIFCMLHVSNLIHLNYTVLPIAPRDQKSTTFLYFSVLANFKTILFTSGWELWNGSNKRAKGWLAYQVEALCYFCCDWTILSGMNEWNSLIRSSRKSQSNTQPSSGFHKWRWRLRQQPRWTPFRETAVLIG